MKGGEGLFKLHSYFKKFVLALFQTKDYSLFPNKNKPYLNFFKNQEVTIPIKILWGT